MRRSAPTVAGSSTSSTIGSPDVASTMRGAAPNNARHASESGPVTAGTTDPIADPMMAARFTSR